MAYAAVFLPGVSAPAMLANPTPSPQQVAAPTHREVHHVAIVGLISTISIVQAVHTEGKALHYQGKWGCLVMIRGLAGMSIMGHACVGVTSCFPQRSL